MKLQLRNAVFAVCSVLVLPLLAGCASAHRPGTGGHRVPSLLAGGGGPRPPRRRARRGRRSISCSARRNPAGSSTSTATPLPTGSAGRRSRTSSGPWAVPRMATTSTGSTCSRPRRRSRRSRSPSRSCSATTWSRRSRGRWGSPSTRRRRDVLLSPGRGSRYFQEDHFPGAWPTISIRFSTSLTPST